MFLAVLLRRRFRAPLWVHCRQGFMEIAFLECLVQGIVVRAICATMEAPPNDDRPAAQPVDVSQEFNRRSRPPSFRVRVVPTQIRGQFALREVLERSAGETSTQNELVWKVSSCISTT